MAAMESSTKNAKEMLGKLTLSYNRSVPCQVDWSRNQTNGMHTLATISCVTCRSRQASITTELTEIISGAAALEEG